MSQRDQVQPLAHPHATPYTFDRAECVRIALALAFAVPAALGAIAAVLVAGLWMGYSSALEHMANLYD